LAHSSEDFYTVVEFSNCTEFDVWVIEFEGVECLPGAWNWKAGGAELGRTGIAPTVFLSSLVE
jgi:hypothetical protein